MDKADGGGDGGGGGELDKARLMMVVAVELAAEVLATTAIRLLLQFR